MNKTKLIQIVAFASLAACTRIPSPSFEMTSPVMLDKTLKEVNLAQLISKPVPIGSRVALIPVANGNINPKDFYTIEENLTQQLIQGGYVVKQKPEAILLDSEGDFKSLPEFTTVMVEGSIDQDGKNIKIDNQSSGFSLPPTSWDRIKALMPDVDSYLVYNIHEYGLIHIPNESAMKMITREFRVKMNVRVVDARDLSIVAIKEYNGQRSDDIHQSTLNALNQYSYDSQSFGFPYLNDGSSKSKIWLDPKTHDFDFMFSAGYSFIQGMYLIKAGIDSDFGRIVVNATAFNLSHSYKDKTKEIKANGLLENSMLSLTYMRRVKSWNQVSLLLGMGPMIYTGGSVMTPLKSLTPELYGLQGIGEFEYSFYRSNLFRLTINAGLMLNGVIPKSYKEEGDDSAQTISAQIVSPYASAGILF